LRRHVLLPVAPPILAQRANDKRFDNLRFLKATKNGFATVSGDLAVQVNNIMIRCMEIDKSYFFPFSPEVVFAAWTSSNTVIAPATRMDIVPVLGGKYHLFVESAEFVSTNKGKFLDIVQDEFLKYSWEWNDDGEVTIITVKFRVDANGTRIHLHHSGFINAESVKMHDSGWGSYFEGLKEYLSHSSSKQTI
jgi:uncharacterized protein YndB with AHSA1/START domain